MLSADLRMGFSDSPLCDCSPHVEFCGYSIPHPSDSLVNLRIQTTGRLTLKPLFIHLLNSVWPFSWPINEWLAYIGTIEGSFAGEISAHEALREALQNLKGVCSHIKEKFEKAVKEKRKEGEAAMDTQ